MVEPKSIVNPPFAMESRPTAEDAEISMVERSTALLSSSDHKCQKSTSGNGHIVYVRRKPETELGKTCIGGNQSDVDCPRVRKCNDVGETTQQIAQMKEAAMCVSNSSPIQMASSSGLPVKRCVSPSRGKLNNISSPANTSNVHVNSSNSLSDNTKRVNVKNWEERYCKLQNVLKMMDRSDHDDYVQMLRSLSSVELSRHAVELEKRSIRLSLEEVKEMQRVCSLDVLGKHPKNGKTSSAE